MADSAKIPIGTTCAACIGSHAAPLSHDEIAKELLTLRPVWHISEDGKWLCRKFVCRNWQSAMEAIQQISVRAESEEIQHHPDLHITNYRDVEIRISTHAVGTLTATDFVLARAIDEIKIDYSPKWLKENPQAADEKA